MKCKPKKIIIYIILIILTLIYILPFLWMINVSLKTNQELMTNPFSMPEVLQLGNYIYAWVNGSLGIAMLNSFIVCSVSLILSLTIDLWRLCHCKNEMETFRMDFELFSAWDDDTCALCTYSFICSVFKIGADRFIDRVNYSIYGICIADGNF